MDTLLYVNPRQLLVLKPRKQAYSFSNMVLYNLRLTTFGLQNRGNLCELAQVPAEIQHLRRRYP